MSLIKLRQSGATKVSKLPKGVFKCILEYQLLKVLQHRYSEPYQQVTVWYQDRHIPPIEKLNYNNYVVAIKEKSEFDC